MRGSTRFDRVLFLLNQKNEQWEKSKTFGRVVNVSSVEFYNAANAGLRVEMQFEIYRRLYKNAEKVIYDGSVYSIIRTRKTKNDKLLLICEFLVVDQELLNEVM
ncbi:phage head closure protein [Alkalicella caledoniensis]|uniref:Phage head closure protein n=1 Tax=Alkalicella caledoniensis TaxID=2731377 RepID=A0A7G9W8B4_ALKCA|nr:phage head closure protein [Alkalicella caledoniensis]QNO14926.1 phage head closure protein [Alkalicella caledoniensis]